MAGQVTIHTADDLGTGDLEARISETRVSTNSQQGAWHEFQKCLDSQKQLVDAPQEELEEQNHNCFYLCLQELARRLGLEKRAVNLRSNVAEEVRKILLKLDETALEARFGSVSPHLKVHSIDEYVQLVKTEGFAGYLEVTAACSVLGIRIRLLTFNEQMRTVNEMMLFGNEKEAEIVELAYHDHHFRLVIAAAAKAASLPQRNEDIAMDVSELHCALMDTWVMLNHAKEVPATITSNIENMWRDLEEFMGKRGIVFTGPSQNGKSTLLNSLLGCVLVPAGHSIAWSRDTPIDLSDSGDDEKDGESAVTHIAVEVIRVPNLNDDAIEVVYHKKSRDQYQEWHQDRADEKEKGLQAARRMGESKKSSLKFTERKGSEAAAMLASIQQLGFKYEDPLPFLDHFANVDQARGALDNILRGRNVLALAILQRITIRGAFPNSLLPYNLPIFDVPGVDNSALLFKARKAILDKCRSAFIVSLTLNIGFNSNAREVEKELDVKLLDKVCLVGTHWTTAVQQIPDHATNAELLECYTYYYQMELRRLKNCINVHLPKIGGRIALVDTQSNKIFNLPNLCTKELQSVVAMMQNHSLLEAEVLLKIRQNLVYLCAISASTQEEEEEKHKFSSLRESEDQLKAGVACLQWPTLAPLDLSASPTMAEQLVHIFKDEFEKQSHSWQSVNAFWAKKGVHATSNGQWKVSSHIPNAFAARLSRDKPYQELEDLTEEYLKSLRAFCGRTSDRFHDEYRLRSLFQGLRAIDEDVADSIFDTMAPWYSRDLDPFKDPKTCLKVMEGHILESTESWISVCHSKLERRLADIKRRVTEFVDRTMQDAEVSARARAVEQTLDVSTLPAQRVRLISQLLRCLKLTPIVAGGTTTPIFDQGLLTISESVLSDIEPVRSVLELHHETVQRIRLRFCGLTDALLERLLSNLTFPFLESIDVTGNFLTAASIPRLAALSLRVTVGCAFNEIPTEDAYKFLVKKTHDKIKIFLRPQQNLLACDSPRINKFAVVLEADDKKSPIGSVAEAGSMIEILQLAKYKIFKDRVVRLALPEVAHPRQNWEDLQLWLKQELPRAEPSMLVFFFSGHGGKTIIAETFACEGQYFSLCELFSLIPPTCNSFFINMCCRTPDLGSAITYYEDQNGNMTENKDSFVFAHERALQQNEEALAIPKLFMALSSPEGMYNWGYSNGNIGGEFEVVQTLLRESFINRISLCAQFQRAPSIKVVSLGRGLQLSFAGCELDANITL